MLIRGGQDFATGLFFVAIGLAAYLIGADYAMGSAQRPGTGVLPRILSWCLMGTGGVLLIKGFLVQDVGLTRWAWRPVIMITVAAVAFSLTVDQLGLVVSMLISMTLAALGTPETRWGEYTLFALGMAVVGVGMFIWGLRMPIPIWPAGLSAVWPWN